MTDKMREEFERTLLKGDLLPCNSVSRRGDDGEYSSVLTTVAWVSWKASRAALCVELPMEYKDQFNELSYSAPAVIKAILDAGVRYK